MFVTVWPCGFATMGDWIQGPACLKYPIIQSNGRVSLNVYLRMTVIDLDLALSGTVLALSGTV